MQYLERHIHLRRILCGIPLRPSPWYMKMESIMFLYFYQHTYPSDIFHTAILELLLAGKNMYDCSTFSGRTTQILIIFYFSVYQRFLELVASFENYGIYVYSLRRDCVNIFKHVTVETKI